MTDGHVIVLTHGCICSGVAESGPMLWKDLGGFFLRLLVPTLLIGVSMTQPGASEARMISFPNAQGYGKLSQGGRGGAIIRVTSLADKGPGSLRACMEAGGPRNCIFTVGGIVRLETPIMVGAENAFLSVLGQTAPGGGILVTINERNKKKKHTPIILKGTNDVIIRHIRLRPRLRVKNVDAITVESSARIYIDHVSGSWATDENFNSHANTTELTVAYSIFGEGLNPHSKCALLGSDPRVPQKITFWNNACISNRDRNPDNNHHGGSCIDIVNNLFYNAESEWAEIFSQYPGGTPISYVGNYFKAGPSTVDKTYAINWNDTESADSPRIYERDNEIWVPGSKMIALVAPDTEQYIVSEPPCPLSVDGVLTPKEAYASVRRYSGAFPRDAVDIRLIEEIGELGVAGHGKMVRKRGKLPAIASGDAYADLDGDGMPDSMEVTVGADIEVGDPWDDSDHDGWSNFDQIMQLMSDGRIEQEYPR